MKKDLIGVFALSACMMFNDVSAMKNNNVKQSKCTSRRAQVIQEFGKEKLQCLSIENDLRLKDNEIMKYEESEKSISAKIEKDSKKPNDRRHWLKDGKQGLFIKNHGCLDLLGCICQKYKEVHRR